MKTIVIVDDSNTIVQVLSAYIKHADDQDYNIVTFDSTEEASDFIIDNYVDLLFQDVHVNGNRDGLISGAIARERDIPVVIITSDSSLDNIMSVAGNKFDRYILKPITQRDVTKAISRLLK